MSDDLDKVITLLAKRDKVPQATKATELLKMAIEMEEDAVLEDIAKKRDTKNAEFVSHEKAWS